MNIKNRLKRIENSHTFTAFCNCYGRFPKYEVALDAESETRTKRLPDVCDKCGKTVDKSELIVTFDEWQKRAEVRRRQAAETTAMFTD